MLESLFMLSKEGRALLRCLQRDAQDAAQNSVFFAAARKAVASMRKSFWTRVGSSYEQERPVFGPLVVYRRVEDQRWSPHYIERREERGLRLKGLKPAAVSGCGDFGIAVVRRFDCFRSDLGADVAVHLYPAISICGECRRTGGAHSDACIAKPGNA